MYLYYYILCFIPYQIDQFLSFFIFTNLELKLQTLFTTGSITQKVRHLTGFLVIFYGTDFQTKFVTKTGISIKHYFCQWRKRTVPSL